MPRARLSDFPRRRFRPGLRLQIGMALAGLMLLAFIPLFFAVASLTRVTVAGAREQAARALVRMIAAHAAEARARAGPGELERALADDFAAGDVDAACIFGPEGSLPVCRGAPADVEAVGALPARPTQAAFVVRGARGRDLQIEVRTRPVSVVARVRIRDVGDVGDVGDLREAPDRGTPLVRLVALYMVTFALALLVFAYVVLTRLIVRPVEKLVDAADRVAKGSRTLRVPRSGARELIELGASVQAMAETLIGEESALIVKVDELTLATARLTDTKAQLARSERMASVGRLAAGVAHEIGNPIAALMGMQDLMLDGGLPPDTERDFLARMRRETERIHTVVRDLLDFARPESASPALGSEMSPADAPAAPADVRAVVDDVVALLRPQKSFRWVRVETDIPADLRVVLSASRLTQVLLNVALNAGAAVASTGAAGGRVVIVARRAAGGVRIDVQDDGIGIAPEVRDRLFEPFVTTKDVGEGSGLGLAVCRGLVESVGGEIGVAPSDGRGARFYVVLPSAPPE